MNSSPSQRERSPQRLAGVVEQVLRRRLTTVIAGPGYGKSTFLAWLTEETKGTLFCLRPSDSSLVSLANRIRNSLDLAVQMLDKLPSPGAGSQDADFETADGFAIALAESLYESSDSPVVLLFDDVQELSEASAGSRLLETLIRNAPSSVHLVLASRNKLPFVIERLRGQGQLFAIDASALALTEAEIANALEAKGLEVGLASQLWLLTGGWPAAVMLSIESLSRGPSDRVDEALASLLDSEAPLVSYLADEVIGTASPEVQEIVRMTSVVEAFSAELLDALGFAEATPAITGLAQRRVLFEPAGVEGGSFRLQSLVRDFIIKNNPLSPEQEDRILTRSGEWYSAQGLFVEALEAYRRSLDPSRLVRFLETHGADLLKSRHPLALLEAFEELRGAQRTPTVQLLAARARLDLGDDDGAEELLLGLASGASKIPAAVGSRLSDIYARRDNVVEAQEILRRVDRNGATPADRARFLYVEGWVGWLEGRVEESIALLQKGAAAAQESGNSYLQTVLLGTLSEVTGFFGDQDKAQRIASEAFRVARETKDEGFLRRLDVHKALMILEQGRYQEALDLIGPVILAVDKMSNLGSGRRARLLVRALLGRAGALMLLGRFDEAQRDLREMKEIAISHRPRLAGLAMMYLGEISRTRGNLALARSQFTEAKKWLEGRVSHHDFLHAEMGLAVATSYEDPAASLDRARMVVDNLDAPCSQLFADCAWLELSFGDPDRAKELSTLASEDARRSQNPRFLADALALEAVLSDPPNIALLDEVGSIGKEIGNPVISAVAGLAASRLSNDPGRRSLEAQHMRTLEQLGVRYESQGAGLLSVVPPPKTQDLEIKTFGKFLLIASGEVVPVSAWPSKKSRDLLKILIARRGAEVHREAIMEMLWPGQDPSDLSNRFSVALSGLRTVLDRQRRWDPDHFVRSEGDTVSLVLDNLSVDVDRFIFHAERGIAEASEFVSEGSRALLETAESLYQGDFLEDDLYEEWAAPVRERSRSLFIEVETTLATDSTRGGDYTGASRRFLRILERDPYDETAHLGLVVAASRAGSHGEARRYFRAYVERMRDLGVEPAPFPETAERALRP